MFSHRVLGGTLPEQALQQGTAPRARSARLKTTTRIYRQPKALRHVDQGPPKMATPQDAKPSSLKQYYVAVGTLDAKLVRRIASGGPRSRGQATQSLQQACWHHCVRPRAIQPRLPSSCSCRPHCWTC